MINLYWEIGIMHTIKQLSFITLLIIAGSISGVAHAGGGQGQNKNFSAGQGSGSNSQSQKKHQNQMQHQNQLKYQNQTRSNQKINQMEQNRLRVEY